MVFTGRDEDVTVAIGGDASGLNEAVDGAIEKLGSLRHAVGLAGAALAGLAAGGLAAATSAAADYEQALVEVEKVTDPSTARAMSDEIRRLAETIPLAQQELAQIAADAGRFGIEGEESMSQFTESVARMATATNLSADQAGEALARLSELTNTPISQVENLGSAINELSNNMATSSQEIVDSMLRSSAALDQLGLNQRQITGLSAALNEVSESSERAGTRLRRVAQELMDPDRVGEIATAMGMTTDEFTRMRDESPVALIEELSRRLSEGGDSADKLRGALTTVSQQALGALGQNLDGTADALDMANSSFEEATSLQEEFAAATDTFNAKLQLLKNQLRNVGIAIGNDILPAATNLVESLTGTLDQFESLNEQLDVNIGTIALVSTVIGGLTAALIALGPTLATAAAGLAAIITPALAVSAAIAALWVAWEKNLGGVRDLTAEVTDSITGWFEENRGTIRETIDSALGLLSGFTSFLRTRLLPAARRVFERILLPIFDRVAMTIERNLGPVLEELAPTFDAIGSHAQTAAKIVMAVWTQIDSVVVPIVEGLAAILTRTLVFAINQVSQGLQLVMNLIQGDFGEAATNLRNILSNLVDFSFDLIGILSDGIDAAVSWIVGEGSEKAAELTGTLIGTLARIAAEMPFIIADGIQAAIKWTKNEGAPKLASLALSIFDWLKTVAFDFPSIISGALNGAKEAIFKALGQLAEWVKERLQTAVESAIKSGFKGSESDGFDPKLGLSSGAPVLFPSRQMGGEVRDSGMVEVHEGETIVPADVTRGLDTDGMSPRAIARELSRALSGMTVLVNTGDETLDRVIDERAQIVVDGRLEQESNRVRQRTGSQP